MATAVGIPAIEGMFSPSYEKSHADPITEGWSQLAVTKRKKKFARCAT